MRILAVHRYYWPDTAPYAAILHSICGQWASEGHCVEVLTSQPSYKSIMANVRRPVHESDDGIDVTRLNLPNEIGRPGIRLYNAIRLGLGVLWKTAMRGYDVIMISTSPPVVGGAAAALAARLTGARFIYHCMDIHPEIGRVSGEFSHPMVFRALSAIDAWTCRRADPVVVLSEDMAATIRSRPGCENCRIEVLNNFSLPAEKGVSELSPFNSSDDVFTILFAGNIGRFQGLETLVDAMTLLRERTDIELVFMGEGVARTKLEKMVASFDVRARFVGQQSVTTAKAAMQEAGAGFVSLVPGLYRYAYPSKTMTYLEQGCPLLVAVEPESQLAREVSEQGLGVCVENGDARALADAIRELADSPESRADMRVAALRKARTEFSESSVLSRWSKLVSLRAGEKGA